MENNIEKKEINFSKDDLITLGAIPIEFNDYYSLKLEGSIFIYAPIGNGKYYLRNEYKEENHAKLMKGGKNKNE